MGHPTVTQPSGGTLLPPVSSAARQYVVSVPTGFSAASARFRTAIRELDTAESGVNVLASVHEDADKLVALTEEEVQQFRASYPRLTVEPNLLYRLSRHPGLREFQEIALPASAATRTFTLTVVDTQSHAPVSEATVYAAVGADGKTGLRAVTDGAGQAHFVVRTTTQSLPSVAVLPRSGYWSRRVLNVPATGGPVTVGLSPLPPVATERYDWGHAFAGMTDGAKGGGRSVRLAVIDTGVWRDHPDLNPTGGRNCVFGEPEADWDVDVDGHGTHCAGVIAALINGRGLKGFAPDVELRSYRVFATGAEGATTFDIGNAMRLAVDDGCDILSMSLGLGTAQSSIRSKVEYAYERGVLCVAATGNEGAAVSYPAAFPTVIAVGAFGQVGSYPQDSIHRETESGVRANNNGLFLANFSNWGEQQVDFCAPGVAVCSTVPGGGYGAWDGTSMACPQIAAMAALAMSARPAIRDAPRDADRVDELVRVLRNAATPLGFGSPYEGAGCLLVSRL